MSLYDHLIFIDFKQDLPYFKYNPGYTGSHDIYMQVGANGEDKLKIAKPGDDYSGLQDQANYAHMGYVPDNVVDEVDLQVEYTLEPNVLNGSEIPDIPEHISGTPKGLPDMCSGECTPLLEGNVEPGSGVTTEQEVGLDINEIIGDEGQGDVGLVQTPPPPVHREETRDFFSRMEGKSVVGKLLTSLSGGGADDVFSIIQDLEEPGECLYCGGSGRTRESQDVCPHCDRKPIDGTLDKNADILQLMDIYVPANYRQEEGKFDVDRILAKYKDESVVALSRASLWLRNLGFILDKIRNKDFKGGQTILGVHASMDNIMYQWMYTGIMAALEAGFSTSAILNPIMIDIYNFPDMSRDVLFFELLSLDYADSFRKLEYICKQRSHHDKPTFIVTNLHLKDLDSIYPVSSKEGVFQAITSYTYSQEYRLTPSVGVRNR